MYTASCLLYYTYLVDLSKRAIPQLANNFPYVVRIHVPVDVLVLLGFLLYFNSGQTKYFAKPCERHYLQCYNIQLQITIKISGSLLAKHCACSVAQPVKLIHKLHFPRLLEKKNATLLRRFKELILLRPFQPGL